MTQSTPAKQFNNQLSGVGTEVSDRSVSDINIKNPVNQKNQNKFNYLVQDVLAKTVREVNKNLAMSGQGKAAKNLEKSKALKQYGIDDANKLIEKVKNLTIETTKTPPAEDIRASIKKLNEQKKTPTQKELGVDYIQRAADDVPRSTGKETTLYNLFKNSGYGGTEDEFYTDFIPDVDRTDQQMISNVLKGGSTGTSFKIDTSNPFAAMGSLKSLFTNTQKQPIEDTQKNSYFTLFGDAEKEAEEKGSSSFDIFNF